MAKKKKREKTPKQNRTLNMLLSRAGLDGEDARDYLEGVCGKRYRREMDFYDFQKAIKDLSEKHNIRIGGDKPRASAHLPKIERKPGGKESDLITPWQMDYIAKLYAGIGADGVAQIEMNKRTVKKPWPQTIGQGQKIIQMLLDMKRRDYRVGNRTDRKGK